MSINQSYEEIQEFSSSEETFKSVQSETLEVDNLYNIQITYGELTKISVCLISRTSDKSPEKSSCIDLNNSLKIREKSNQEKQNNLTSILKKVTDNRDKVPAKKKSVNFILPTPLNRTSPRFTAQHKRYQDIDSTFLLGQKIFIVIETYFTNYIKGLKFHNGANRVLIQAFEWIKAFDIYLKLIQQAVMISKKRHIELSAASGSSETTAKPKKNVSSSEEYSKRLHRKLTENQKLIMQNDDSKTTIEKDCSYAYNYLDRVKKTLIDCGDDELYTEFMAMLTTFDPQIESVPELYRASHMNKLLTAN